MENAATRMVRSEDPIRHHVRRKVRCGVMVNPASHTRFLTLPPCPEWRSTMAASGSCFISERPMIIETHL
jgi:hypothetical protein